MVRAEPVTQSLRGSAHADLGFPNYSQTPPSGHFQQPQFGCPNVQNSAEVAVPSGTAVPPPSAASLTAPAGQGVAERAQIGSMDQVPPDTASSPGASTTGRRGISADQRVSSTRRTASDIAEADSRGTPRRRLETTQQQQQPENPQYSPAMQGQNAREFLDVQLRSARKTKSCSPSHSSSSPRKRAGQQLPPPASPAQRSRTSFESRSNPESRSEFDSIPSVVESTVNDLIKAAAADQEKRISDLTALVQSLVQNGSSEKSESATLRKQLQEETVACHRAGSALASGSAREEEMEY